MNIINLVIINMVLTVGSGGLDDTPFYDIHIKV